MSAFREKIVCFGDSITQEGFEIGGWVALLSNLYRRRADVLNRGYSGYNTRKAIHMLDFIFPAETPCLLSTVFFGANDSASSITKADQHIPLDEFLTNISSIVDRALVVSRVVVVITPPPVDTLRWPDRTNDFAGEYARGIVSLINEKYSSKNVFVLDLFTLMTSSKYVEGAPGTRLSGDPVYFSYLSDGLHLNGAGNAFVCNHLMQLLDQKAPFVLPDSLTIDFPLWRTIGNDHESTMKAFSKEALDELHAVARPIWK